MYSLRMKLNDVISGDEQVILENIRRCKLFSGKTFKVIFRNDGLSKKECKDFVKRNEKLLFEVTTKITKKFEYSWFLIKSDGDKSNKRYSYKGGILNGIAEYIKMVKHLKEKENEN